MAGRKNLPHEMWRQERETKGGSHQGNGAREDGMQTAWLALLGNLTFTPGTREGLEEMEVGRAVIDQVTILQGGLKARRPL